MNKLFYPKLAAVNLRKNKRTYIPYILTCIGTIMMYYIIAALSENNSLRELAGGSIIAEILKIGTEIVGFFSVIFLFYTNSFLIKRRKKEFGLYNILGMEKKHILKIILFESIYVAVISIIVGCAAGMLLSKLVFLLVLKMLDFEVMMGFEISASAIRSTVILFGIIFLLTFIYNVRQIHLSKPVELLKGGEVGEREPKTKWFCTVLGILCLGSGYYIAVTTKDPLEALTFFFVAVILVIIGTYCLFTSGSIALLKILRKNKKYYYQTKHFISVSGMMYRMKQNAIGLGNICILSTAVLVMISSTVSLYIGMKDMLVTRYPRDYMIVSYNYSEESIQKIDELLQATEEKYGVEKEDFMQYTYLEFASQLQGDYFESDTSQAQGYTNIKNLYFIPLEQYNAITGAEETLKENEVLIFYDREKYPLQFLKIFDLEYSVKKQSEDFVGIGFDAAQIVPSFYIVMKDMNEIEVLDGKQKEVYGENASPVRYYCGFNYNTGEEENRQIYDEIKKNLKEDESFYGYIEGRSHEKDEFYSLYGSLFFLGIFLGILFIMATVLIIYYKQISEGYDDKERFEIMQKVGMSRNEVKKSIHSQVLTVFFLPLVTAGVHILFAFPVITKLLAVFNLTNVTLFAWCTVGTFLIFAAVYAIVYGMTARIYYKIVS
jgi:putative ABC transport system permease protein